MSILLTIVALMMVMTCFAANSVITRYLVSGNYISPLILVAIRFASGFLMLQLLVSLMPKTFQKTRIRGWDILGALFLGIYAFSISYGYVFISAAAGVLIFYTFVVITMTSFSVINDREKLTIRLILGQLLGLFGVLVITFSGISSVTLTGACLMAITGTSWGMYSVYSRRFKDSFSYTYNTFLIFGIAASTLLLATYSLGVGYLTISISSLWWALYLGMISTALSYALWHKVMKKIKASQGGITQLLVPVLTSLMGILILREEVTSPLILGGILILAGISLNLTQDLG
jgi:drug/metabolite transporter (DMT)-like permease